MESKVGWLGQDEAVVKSQATANNFMLHLKQRSLEETPTMRHTMTELINLNPIILDVFMLFMLNRVA
jgi:hypothetical protein